MPKCQRKIEKFKEKHQQFLDSKMTIHIERAAVKECSVGRPRLTYDEGSSRLKRKIASDIATSQGHNTAMLFHAATICAKKSKCNECTDCIDCSLKENIINVKRKSDCNQKPVQMTADEALAFLLENSFSKKQYNAIRAINQKHGCDIFPCYDNVFKAKSECRPVGIQATETSAQVSLQNMLNHTAKRIIIFQKEVFAQFESITDVKLIVTYGFDGSTGHSLYKQQFEEKVQDTLDQSLFVTSIIPIKLLDSLGRVLWMNSKTQSVRFCRPLKIEFIKESKEHILAENNRLKGEIENLKPYLFNNWSGRTCFV
ncbi:uncharacterized protein LOC128869320 [Anastrepha ludens]|uniref:uncharacterized protein LOC128863836 n=1 Tax=Anastrepha ludens TaxID=28586 RepID=UPI0023B12679|nr:uncharacterized protein LOC128863836 [Anastrepha ludens]XP_053967823.1 uncharacterized protein LOC128869320 [Anastrepha ludens]